MQWPLNIKWEKSRSTPQKGTSQGTAEEFDSWGVCKMSREVSVQKFTF